MTVWARATCEGCGKEVGPRHPVFTTRRDLPWTPFVACGICGLILCRECCPGAGCSRCGDPWVEDDFPRIWLNVNRSAIWASHWCQACRKPTRPESSGLPPDPAVAGDARWFACCECAREYCEPCATARPERCYCRAHLVLRGVGPLRAYLRGDLREKLVGLSRAQEIELLERERAAVVRSYEEGLATSLEARARTWAIDRVLVELGVDPGPQRW